MRRPALFIPLSERNFRLFLTGHALASISVWMQKLAQAWLVLELTDSAFWLGMTVAFQQLPTLLFATNAGALADRLDKRRLVMGTALYSAMPALIIGLAQHFDVVATWMVMSAALAQGMSDAIDKPSRMTLVNDVTPMASLGSAVALSNIAQEVGKLIGPAVGGILIGLVGLPTVFLINAALYIPVVVMMFLIKVPARVLNVKVVPLRRSLSSTLRYVRGRPDLAVGLGLMAVSGLFAYNFNVLVTLLVRNDMGGSAAQAGFAFTSLGLGGIAGGLVIAGLITMNNRSQLIIAGCFAAVFTSVALSPNLAFAYAALFLVGALSVTFRSVTASMLQVGSDPDMRGRVISLYYLALIGTSPIGAPLQGWLSGLTSARVGFVLGGAATALAAVVGRSYLKSQQLLTDRDASVTGSAPRRRTWRRRRGTAST